MCVCVFPCCLWANPKRGRWAEGGLAADVWPEHCVCREVRGQEKCCGTVIGQSGACPLAEPSIVWTEQVKWPSTRTSVHRPTDRLPGAELSSAHYGRGEKLCVWPDTVKQSAATVRFPRVSCKSGSVYAAEIFSLSLSPSWLEPDFSRNKAWHSCTCSGIEFLSAECCFT